MSGVLAVVLVLAGVVYAAGTIGAFLAGLMDYSAAAEGLERADRYPNIAESLRRDARKEIARSYRLVRYPYLWPRFVIQYVRRINATVASDTGVKR